MGWLLRSPGLCPGYQDRLFRGWAGYLFLVATTDAVGDCLKLLRHSPHVVVVAAGYDLATGDVTTDQDPCSEPDQPGLGLSAKEPVHGLGPV
jgi:hypothetical protein